MGAALTIGLLVLLTRLGLLTVVLLLGLARLALRVLLPGLLALCVIGLLLRALIVAVLAEWSFACHLDVGRAIDVALGERCVSVARSSVGNATCEIAVND